MTMTEPRTPAMAADAPPAEKPRKEHGAWYWLFYGLTAGLLAIILGIGVVAVALPKLTGSVPLTVLSSSMEPALPPGTMAVVRPLAPQQLGEIHIGDIISFQPYPNDPTLVTHRVIGITHLSSGNLIFETQGDANSAADAPVLGKQVRAKLWYSIPGLGWVNDLVNTQGNRAWIIPTAAGLLFTYAGYTVVYSAVDRAKEKRAAKASAEP
ncbi:signal peptidase I [Gryllotalpicola koreensis]|uniref:Signal peptidase I n=1 Tax=Gryllotalpicola koreensis TaxID=993086 RepID=A0ABP7ZQ88_9MICO